ncbi:hypothetical protein HND97_11490 [Vibrio cholerae]|nr:hypothetical protein HND97_11490 [Vibrio cholerae]
MIVLTLLTKQIDGEFTVYWKTGLRRGGELNVDFGEQYDKLPEQKKPIAAELYAIHQLQSVNVVMGVTEAVMAFKSGSVKEISKVAETTLNSAFTLQPD